MNGKKLNTRIGLIGLFVLVAFGVAVLMAVMPAGAVTTGDAYPGYGDWDVNNATRVIDEEIIVYGDLNVAGAVERHDPYGPGLRQPVHGQRDDER